MTRSSWSLKSWEIASMSGNVRRIGYGLDVSHWSRQSDSRELELLVDVGKDQDYRFLYLLQVGCRQQLVKGKVFHEDVVLVHYHQLTIYTSMTHQCRWPP